MGGKAIDKVQVGRMDLDVYKQVKQYITNTFASLDITINFPFDRPGKETFGDLDVLYKLNPESSFVMIDYIREKFNPVQIVTNGDVISWSYEFGPNQFYQIDMIKCENLNMAKFYFSYGDLGNIVGRMSKFWGLKFGHDGLWVLVDSELIKTYAKLDLNPQTQLLLSTNPSEICDYLDLDWNQWASGFVDLNQIFQWVKSSKFYNPQIYSYSNYSHRHKQETRPMYSEFINSIDFNNSDTKFANLTNPTKLNAIMHFNKSRELDLIIQEEQLKNARKEKFNGKKLISMGLAPSQLGKFIPEFKKFIESTQYTFPGSTWDQWLDSTSQEQIDWLIYQQIII
jgi:hypothetical protein